MREIKFRAWDKEAEEMYYSNQSYADHFFEFKGEGLFCFSIIQNGFPGSLHEPPSPSCEEVDNLMQFTGLHDKNGKEIWESDVCKWIKVVVVIAWDDDAARFKTKISSNGQLGFIPFYDLEVIGNLYENPELLEP